MLEKTERNRGIDKHAIEQDFWDNEERGDHKQSDTRNEKSRERNKVVWEA